MRKIAIALSKGGDGESVAAKGNVIQFLLGGKTSQKRGGIKNGRRSNNCDTCGWYHYWNRYIYSFAGVLVLVLENQ